MKKTITILLSSLLFMGCAGRMSRKDLEAQVGQLSGKVETLKDQRYNLCALNMEMVTGMGMKYIYLGNKTFLQIQTGQTRVLDGLVEEACLPVLERYLMNVSARSQQQ